MSDKPDFMNTPVSGTTHTDPTPPNTYTDSAEIEELFDAAFDSAPDHPFLVSVYEWWEDKQFLTPKQYAAVSRFAGHKYK